MIDILIPPGVVSVAGGASVGAAVEGAAVVGASVVSKNITNTLLIIVESKRGTI